MAPPTPSKPESSKPTGQTNAGGKTGAGVSKPSKKSLEERKGALTKALKEAQTAEDNARIAQAKSDLEAVDQEMLDVDNSEDAGSAGAPIDLTGDDDGTPSGSASAENTNTATGGHGSAGAPIDLTGDDDGAPPGSASAENTNTATGGHTVTFADNKGKDVSMKDTSDDDHEYDDPEDDDEEDDEADGEGAIPVRSMEFIAEGKKRKVKYYKTGPRGRPEAVVRYGPLSKAKYRSEPASAGDLENNPKMNISVEPKLRPGELKIRRGGRMVFKYSSADVKAFLGVVLPAGRKDPVDIVDPKLKNPHIGEMDEEGNRIKGGPNEFKRFESAPVMVSWKDHVRKAEGIDHSAETRTTFYRLFPAATSVQKAEAIFNIAVHMEDRYAKWESGELRGYSRSPSVSLVKKEASKASEGPKGTPSQGVTQSVEQADQTNPAATKDEPQVVKEEEPSDQPKTPKERLAAYREGWAVLFNNGEPPRSSADNQRVISDMPPSLKKHFGIA